MNWLKSGFHAAVRLVLVAIAAFMPVRAAHAQIIPGVPDPINTRDLERCATVLGLSDEQTVSLIDVHERYIERYRAFESRDVKELTDTILTLATSAMRTGMRIPERADLEKIITLHTRVMDGAVAVDRTFYDELITTLSEEQAARLDRARTARTLRIYRELVGEMVEDFNEGAQADLTDIVSDVHLERYEIAVADRAAIELEIESYERTMLSRLTDIHRALLEVAKVVLDTIDAWGLRTMTPEAMFEMMQEPEMLTRVATIFDDASKPVQKAAAEASQLNYSAYRRIMNLLPVDAADELRKEFFDEAYDDFYENPSRWRTPYKMIIEGHVQGLSAEQVENLRQQYESFVTRDNAVAESAAADIERLRVFRSFNQMNGEADDPVDDRANEAEEAREAIERAALDALHVAFGVTSDQELQEKLGQAAHNQEAARARAEAEAQAAAAEVMAGAEVVPVAAEDSSALREWEALLSGEFLRPPALGWWPIGRLAQSLRLGDGEVEIIRSLYETYLSEYQPLFDMQVTPVPQPEEAAAEALPAERKPAGEEADARLAATRAHFNDLMAADARFFENVRMTLLEPWHQQALDALSQLRRRTAEMASARRAMWWLRRDSESSADVVWALIASGADAATWQAALPHLEGYAAQLAPLAPSVLDAACRFHRQDLVMQVMMEREEQVTQNYEQFYETRRRDAMRDSREVNQQWRTLNRSTLDRVLESSPQAGRWSIRAAYLESAYPDIYVDHLGTRQLFERALQQNDLSEPQRDRIAQAAEAFRARFESVCDRMVNARQTQEQGGGMGFEMPTREQLEQELTLQRLQFERQEAGERARLMLLAILSEEQEARLNLRRRRS